MTGPSRFFLLISTILLLAINSAVAMQDMDDADLRESVAQDGVTVRADFSYSMDAYRWVDKSGIGTGTSAVPLAQQGQLIQRNMGVTSCQETTSLGSCTLTTGATGLVMIMDTAAAASGDSLLSVGITLSRKIRLHLAGLSLGNVGTGSLHQPTTSTKVIEINPTSTVLTDKYIDILTASGGELRLDMGNQPTGGLLTANNFQVDRIEINGGMAILDAASACTTCGLRVGGYRITGVSGGSVNLSGSTMGVNSSNGLYLTLGPSVTMDVAMTGVQLGDYTSSAPGLGNVSLNGLNMSGATITLRGR